MSSLAALRILKKKPQVMAPYKIRAKKVLEMNTSGRVEISDWIDIKLKEIDLIVGDFTISEPMEFFDYLIKMPFRMAILGVAHSFHYWDMCTKIKKMFWERGIHAFEIELKTIEHGAPIDAINRFIIAHVREIDPKKKVIPVTEEVTPYDAINDLRDPMMEDRQRYVHSAENWYQRRLRSANGYLTLHVPYYELDKHEEIMKMPPGRRKLAPFLQWKPRKKYPYHYTEPRRITGREYMRLLGYPDDFVVPKPNLLFRYPHPVVFSRVIEQLMEVL